LTIARDEAVARLTQADMDYQDAQKKAEAAIALAQQRRAELDTIRAEEGAISVRLAKSSEVLSAESLLTDDLTHKTLKLREKSDLAQSELTQAKLEIEAIEKNLLLQTETTKKLELEIEATQQAVEDSQARELSYRDAIDHLELGGSPEDIVDVECETGHALISSKTAKTMSVSERRNFVSDGLMGRVRSTFARKKDAEISIETDDIVLPEPAAKTDPVLLSGVDKSPLFFRRHSSSLMALGAVLGGIAILGAGITLNTSASPKLKAKSAVAAPTQVMSAVSTASKQVIKPQVTAAVNTKKDISEDNSAQETKMSDPKVEIKFAEVVDPVGFAFELPDMRPTALGRENTVALKAKKPIKDDVDKAAPTKKVEVVNYPELTKDVQTRLTGLGFYAGEIDGLQGATTKNAIRIFRELFLLPEGDNITGALLTALKRAEREQEAALLLKQAQDAATRNVQMVEAPRPRFNSAISSEPARPIMTDTTPVATTWTAPVESAPVYAAPAVSSEPEASSNVGKIAILSTAAIVAPVVSNLRKKDVIKEASLLRSASANYPSLAQRRNYFVNVNIVVEYDIDDKGRAQNLRIASNDHDGKYKGAFEKEALKAIEKMRYKPKTVNGIATKTTGKEKRIVFRVE
jgi:peptidoglycan hydrolase-like protein with peptidoglycan-binding domain